ncbi:MAG: glycosyltransferase family 2 protein [Brevinema sp.]
MHYPLVSVIIPTYNRKDMLVEALDSVLAQDYPNMEIIIADNASIDGTELIIEKYCEKHTFIKYIRRPENLGGAKNGQLAYLEATGDYMMILCDDDLLVGSSFFFKAVKTMEENKNIAFVRGLVVTLIYNEDTYYNIMPYNTRCLIDGLEFYLNYESEGYEHVRSFFGLCRKRWIDESKIMDKPKNILDRWLWSVLPLYGDVYFIPEIIGYYRKHRAIRDSTSVEFAMKFFEIYEVINMISQLAIQLHPDKKEEILSRRNPDIEAAEVIKFFLDIMRPYKSDAELLKMIHPLRSKPILYKKLLNIMSLGLKNKFLLKVAKLINRIIDKIGIKIIRK